MKKTIFTFSFLLYHVAMMAQMHGFGFSYYYKNGQESPQDDPFSAYYVVNSIYPGSPASQAGIMTGDKITAINGIAISKKSLDEVKEMMKPETIEIKTSRNNQEYAHVLTKSFVDIDTLLFSGLNRLLLQADSSFGDFKGAATEKAFIYESKIQLTPTHQTILRKHMFLKQHDVVSYCYSGASPQEAMSVFARYEQQLNFYFGLHVYSQEYQAADTSFFHQISFSKKTFNGYQACRTYLSSFRTVDRSHYEVALVVEGGIKPSCVFVNPDTTQTSTEFRNKIQYLFNSFYTNKVHESLAGAPLYDGATSYYSKYCFKDAQCMVFTMDDVLFSHKLPKYYFTAEYRWLSQQKADSVFNELYRDIQNSLSNQFVYYEKVSEFDHIFDKRSIVFAADLGHIMPYKEHFITLALRVTKDNNYTVKIEME